MSTVAPEPAPDVTPPRRPWLTRKVKVLCGVSFLQDSTSELPYPVLPIFLTTALSAPAAPPSPNSPPDASPTAAPGDGR